MNFNYKRTILSSLMYVIIWNFCGFLFGTFAAHTGHMLTMARIFVPIIASVAFGLIRAAVGESATA